MAIGTPRSAAEDAEESGDDSLFAEINITPLTDVFLVMVIIFMVSALAVQVEAENQKKEAVVEKQKAEIEKKSGLKVTLPSGASQEIDLTKKSLILVIPVSGDIVANGVSVKDDQLDNVFRRAFLEDKQTQVVLQADKAVQNGRMIEVMERAKGAGLTRLAIGTTSK
jgi:biopolymer transport protein ExbD